MSGGTIFGLWVLLSALTMVIANRLPQRPAFLTMGLIDLGILVALLGLNEALRRFRGQTVRAARK